MSCHPHVAPDPDGSRVRVTVFGSLTVKVAEAAPRMSSPTIVAAPKLADPGDCTVDSAVARAGSTASTAMARTVWPAVMSTVPCRTMDPSVSVTTWMWTVTSGPPDRRLSSTVVR